MSTRVNDAPGAGSSVDLPEDDALVVAEAARWAPSIHNSQPWRLRRLPDGLAVLEDPQRALPVIDPTGRDRLVSCGAALLNARVALAALGHRVSLDLLPVPAEPTLVGVVRTLGRAVIPTDEQGLAAMIPLRHSHRRVYRSHVIAENDLLDLRQTVLLEGARLGVIEPTLRRRLAHLMVRAVRDQAGDPALRAETEHWVRRSGGSSDGIPGRSLGTSPFPVDSVVHAGHAGAPDVADLEDELSRSTVLVIATRGDTRRDWLTAGLALERLLLTATAKGLVASFADQVLQDGALRGAADALLGDWGHPQTLLRVGRPLVDPAPTPRRPVSDLWQP